MSQKNKNLISEQVFSSDEEHTSVSDLRKLMEKQFGKLMSAIQGVDGRVMKLEYGMERLLNGTKSDMIEIKAHSSGPRRLKLVFRNKISLPVLNGEEIKGEGGKYLEVALVDNVTGNVVDFGREASAHVEIVALEGDSDHCERETWVIGTYKNKIDCANEEKKPVLTGPVKLKLNKGIGSLVNVKFRNSSIHNSGKFKLGAKVIDSFDGTLVKEAMTESFVVKDFREKYKQKHYPPSLSDEIWRLENIQKGGAIYERAKQQVNSVEDFLIQLLKDREGLKRLLGLPEKKWKATVNHARTCTISQKVYCGINSQENKGVVFNVIGKILGLIKDGKYDHCDMLSQEEKVEGTKLIKQEEVKCFDNEHSLLQYLSFLSTLVSTNSPRPKINVSHEAKTSTIGRSDEANIDASSQEAPLHDPICMDQSNIGTNCQEAEATAFDPFDNPTACTGLEALLHAPICISQSNVNEMNLNATSHELRSKHPSGGSVLQEAEASMNQEFDFQNIFKSSNPTGDIRLDDPVFSPLFDVQSEYFDASLQESLFSWNEVEASEPCGSGLHNMEMRTNRLLTPDKQYPILDPLWMNQDHDQPFSSLHSDNIIGLTRDHTSNYLWKRQRNS